MVHGCVLQSFQLRQLEERLLDTISAVQGTILDDDTVVQALEDLKGEAGDVAKEVGKERRGIFCCVVLCSVNSVLKMKPSKLQHEPGRHKKMVREPERIRISFRNPEK